jgi:hypothetical protein
LIERPNPDYPHIVEVAVEQQIQGEAEKLHYPPTSEEFQMISNLRTLTWRRVDCLFRGYFASILNHTNVHVSYPIVNSIGKDVVEHAVREVLAK